MTTGRRLDRVDHSSLPWRIHDIAPDFELVDAWALPARGTLAEFTDLCAIIGDLKPDADESSIVLRALFALRFRLGAYLGWDEDANTLPIPGCVETTLRARLPPDLEAEVEPTAGKLPFRPIFRTDDEWALELSNSTVHAILHVGWVRGDDHTYRGQLGVYVKHRDRIGRPYMAAIGPFRHFVVYPALIRRIDHAWKARDLRRGVVAVIHSAGKFLWIRRGPDVVKPGYWMPPSGSIEPGETAKETIVREMAEELGLAVRPIRQVWQCRTEDAGFMLDWWLTEIEDGEPRTVDGEVAEIRWVTAEEIHELSPTFASHLKFIDDVWPTLG